MSPVRTTIRTLLAVVVLLLTAGCSVTVPESRAPALGAQYYGGYAVVTTEAGSRYGRCGDGISPMEAEAVAGPQFPGPWLQDGQTVRVGNMVCERSPGAVSCAHLQTGHGFLVGQDNYELW
jgi:hypothetical protein